MPSEPVGCWAWLFPASVVSLGERITVLARDRIYADFVSVCRPRRYHTILDVGVSDVVNDAANMMERKYPHAEMITAVTGLAPLGIVPHLPPHVRDNDDSLADALVDALGQDIVTVLLGSS